MSPRLVSLDAFRGFVVAAMLVVNNPGRPELAPYQLGHAPWGQGITFTDLVMPWFLFTIGASLPFALDPARGTGPLLRRALVRCATLIVLGILLVSSAQHRLVIGLDVLQHLGLAGLFATLAWLWCKRRRWLVALAILAAHTLLLRTNGPLDEHDNVVARINRDWLAPLHLAGLLSPIATSALVILGTYAGEALADAGRTVLQRALRLAGAGVVLAALGWLWHFDLMFSKALWTAPYLLFSGGLALVILAVAHALVEGLGARWLAAPWLVFGRNAILAYFGAIVVKHHTVDEWRTRLADGPSGTIREGSVRDAIVETFIAWFGGPWGSFAWTLSWLALVWLACAWCYRRKLFWRV